MSDFEDDEEERAAFREAYEGRVMPPPVINVARAKMVEFIAPSEAWSPYPGPR